MKNVKSSEIPLKYYLHSIMRSLFYFLVLTGVVTHTGCGSGSPDELSAEDMAAYSPVPMENVVLLETDTAKTLKEIAASLGKYQAAYINSICVRMPATFNKNDLKSLVDSCHQAGINFFLHTHNPDEVKTSWVHNFNVDGFHCTNALAKSGNHWQQKIDSFGELKSVLMIAHNANDELKTAGFSASSDVGFSTALQNVMQQDLPVNKLDTALLGEKDFFVQAFPALHRVPRSATGNPAEEKAMMLAAFAQPGVPFLTEEVLNAHTEFLQQFLDYYVNSPVLQYGEYMFYDAATRDVFTIIRDFQGKKLLFAINMRNRPASYKWPDNLIGIKSELVWGEKISRNGGQELPPFGYQVMSFENIVGVQPLELDYKD